MIVDAREELRRRVSQRRAWTSGAFGSPAAGLGPADRGATHDSIDPVLVEHILQRPPRRPKRTPRVAEHQYGDS